MSTPMATSSVSNPHHDSHRDTTTEPPQLDPLLPRKGKRRSLVVPAAVRNHTTTSNGSSFPRRDGGGITGRQATLLRGDPSMASSSPFRSYDPFPVSRYRILQKARDEGQRICPHAAHANTSGRTTTKQSAFIAYDNHDNHHVVLTVIPKATASLLQLKHVRRVMATLSRGVGFQRLLQIWDYDGSDDSTTGTAVAPRASAWVFVQDFQLSWVPLDLFCEATSLTEDKLRQVVFEVVSMVHFLHAHRLAASGQLCATQDFMVNAETQRIVWLISPSAVLSGCMLAHATPARFARDISSIGYLTFHLSLVTQADALLASACAMDGFQQVIQDHLKHLSRPCRAMILCCLMYTPTIDEVIKLKWLRHVDFVTIVPKLSHLHHHQQPPHRRLVLHTLWSKLASFFLENVHQLAAAGPSVMASLSEEEEVETTRRHGKKPAAKKVYVGRHVSLHGHHHHQHHQRLHHHNHHHQHHQHSLTRIASVGGGSLVKRGMLIVPPLGSAILPHGDGDSDDDESDGSLADLPTTRSFALRENKRVTGPSDETLYEVSLQEAAAVPTAYDSFAYAFPFSPLTLPSLAHEYDSFEGDGQEDKEEIFLVEVTAPSLADAQDDDGDGHRSRVGSLLLEENGHDHHHHSSQSLHSVGSLSDLRKVMRSLHSSHDEHQHNQKQRQSWSSTGSLLDPSDHQTLDAAIQARAFSKDGLDPVHLSAFGPHDICFRETFRVDIWAYLRQQRQEMLETALEINESEVAHRVQPMEIARGTLITVSIEPNHSIRVVGEDCKSFRWRGDVNGVSFDLQRKPRKATVSIVEQEEEEEDTLCIARIVAGTSVSLLFIRLRTSTSQTSTAASSSASAMLLSTRLEHLVANVPEILPQQLEPLYAIGKGAFGEAVLAIWKERNTHVVIKSPHYDALRGGDRETVEAFRHEAAVMQMLGKHPHVVELLGITSAHAGADDKAAIVTEYLSNGSLHDLLMASPPSSSSIEAESSSSSPLSLFSRTVMARDAAHGIVNIHQGHVLHRDIAARNCLLDANFRVKVCDFGLSRPSNVFFDDANHGFGPIKWMAPESVLPPHLFSTYSDSYMFGVLLYEIFSGKLPFQGLPSRDAMALILEGQHVPIPDHLPLAHQQLMKKCFDPHPFARPSMDEILVTLDQWILSDTRTHSRRYAPMGIL